MHGKPKRFKSLGVRALSGVVLILICGLPIYFGGWLMTAMIALLGARMIWEWVRMTDSNFPIPAFILPILGLWTALYFANVGNWKMAIGIMLVCCVFAFIERIRRGGAGWAGFGVLYIILPCLAMLWLRSDMGVNNQVIGFTSPGFAKLVFVILIVIAADSFAYLGGSMLKGPKLAPRISPNKTWSGFISGLIFGAITGTLAAYITGFSIVHGFLFAVPIVIASVFGDLLESAIKRKLKVKDAGGLIPGHGGLLDRLDSLMFAVILASAVLLLWPGMWSV